MKTSPRRTFLKNASLALGAASLSSLPLHAAPEEQEPARNFRKLTINLWKDKSRNNAKTDELRPRLDIFMPEGKSTQKRAAIIVCPGGGYSRLAPHEGQPLAELFAAQGIVGAVLTYRHNTHRHPEPFSDAARAIRLMRHHATDLNLDPQRIGIMGFSAGGHLAATVAFQPDLYKEPEDDLARSHSARPDRVILGYPVISFGPLGHQGSAANLLGPNPDPKMVEQLSNEKQITANAPPAFLFHTADDAGVPVQNSLMVAEAYTRHKIPYALHVYPKGRHGVGMATDNPELKSWTDLLVNWLADWTTAPAKG
jgi:acetyl esterase/lipase